MTTIFPMLPPAVGGSISQNADSVEKQVAAPTDFNQVLARVRHRESTGSPQAAPVPMGQRIRLGELNGRLGTVSDLLVQHPEYRNDTWKIIQNPVNRNKPYEQVPNNTSIYLNPKTRELSWQGVPETYEQGAAQGVGSSGESAPNPAFQKAKLAYLGQLSKTAPTISHLLVSHPQGGKDTWEIIHGAQNRSKSFNNLPRGTEIYLNPATGELSWPKQPEQSKALADARPTDQAEASPMAATLSTPPQTSPQMARAVRSFMGQSYGAMDCYELVINGLEKMGVRYLGQSGLKANLVDKALRAGLPANAYLTGEGIIEATGSRLYAQTIPARRGGVGQIQKVMNDLRPLLGPGDILSFSTPSRGHVGVVDRREDAWTFVNSGYLDHEMQARRPRKGVGEELLSAEIQNWLALASRRREPLQISLGRLEPHKLRDFHSS